MVTLLILDGYGIGNKDENDAVFMAETPTMNSIEKEYPSTTLLSSGEHVGLIPHQMGNSEVGHLNIGAGRVVFQDLARINNAVLDKTFFENKAIGNAISHCINNSSNLHVMGLLSDGGVHSSIEHLKSIISYAKKENFKNVYVHAITDGRDVFRDSSVKFILDIKNFMSEEKIGTLASVVGRVYAMDREKRYDRLKIAYDLFVYGKSEIIASDVIPEIKKQHENKVFDEFIPAIKVDKTPNIESNDAVVFFNYRTDRAREISQALSQKTFKEFETKKLDNLFYVCMTKYDDSFENVNIAFPPNEIKNTLSEVLAFNNKKQFRVTETTKYAHITFFFNGGIEKAFPFEERELVESIDVKDFSLYPKMKAEEITKKAVDAILSENYDFILINLSNPDMIGHTGNFEATKQAIECVDSCVEKLKNACLKVKCDLLVTADHGNAEFMCDDKGNIITSHTTNNVPFVLVSEKHKNVRLISDGKLANISPTILKLLNVAKPNEMNENPLF